MNIRNEAQIFQEETKQIQPSSHQSDWENSELKETADFFRPSPTSFESRHKRFSFGKKTEQTKKSHKQKAQITYIENSSQLIPKDYQQHEHKSKLLYEQVNFI